MRLSAMVTLFIGLSSPDLPFVREMTSLSSAMKGVDHQ